MTATQNVALPNPLAAFIVELFRLNGVLLAEGDRMTHDLGLSSARWQVLGAVELAGRALPVSQIARNMGLTRQSVQRVVNELHADRLVAFSDNPHHRRAKLLFPTAKGREAFRAAMSRQALWAGDLLAASKTSEKQVAEATNILQKLRLALMETQK